MKYEVHITCADTIDYSLLEDVIRIANLGGTIKPNTLPRLTFPSMATLIVEADEPPMPSPTVRVFEVDSRVEITMASLEKPAEAATFSMEADDLPVTGYTKQELDAMDFETQFRAVCKSVGVVGRSRDKMTKEYLAKFE